LPAPYYLSAEEIAELHEKIIGRIGGKLGVRDLGALESCAAQPRTAVFGQERFSTLFDKAAAYCYFIVRLHPFFDGNKRTGLVAAITFLLENGIAPIFDEGEMYDAILSVANGEMDVEGLAAIFRRCTEMRGEDSA
jgi:death-on-curing protein